MHSGWLEQIEKSIYKDCYILKVTKGTKFDVSLVRIAERLGRESEYDAVRL